VTILALSRAIIVDCSNERLFFFHVELEIDDSHATHFVLYVISHFLFRYIIEGAKLKF